MDITQLKEQVQAIKKKLLDLFAQLRKKKQKDETSEANETTTSASKEEKIHAAVLEKIPQKIKSSLQSAGKKQKIITFCVLIGLGVLIIGGVIWHNISSARQETQAVMQQLAIKPVLIKVLGQNIQATHRGDGKIKLSAMTGQMIIPVQGALGSGKLSVRLKQGVFEQIELVQANGVQVDILAAEKQAQAEAKKKAALKAEEQAREEGFKQAIQAMQDDNYSVAIPKFEQAIQGNYRVADANEYLGIIYSQQGNYAQCIERFKAYLTFKTDNSNVYYQLAYCYLQRYDTNNALIYLQKACLLNNDKACQAATQIKKQQALFKQQVQGSEQLLSGPKAADQAVQQETKPNQESGSNNVGDTPDAAQSPSQPNLAPQE